MDLTNSPHASLVAEIEHIHNLLKGANFQAVDDYFKQCKLRDPLDLHITRIRCTYVCRDYLKEWGPYLRRVKADLEDEGIDANAFLHGLIPRES